MNETLQRTRIALAGFGAWGQMHLRALQAIGTAEVVAVYCHGKSSDAAARRLLPETRRFSDYDAMLAAGGLDVVSVTVPNSAHADFAISALEAGAHVFLEKPLGLDLGQCDAVIAASARTGRLVALDHELRVSHQWGAVRDLIARGDLGSVRFQHFSLFRHPFREGSGGWRYEPAKVGSWILEELVHFFDLVLWYAQELAPPLRVHAFGSDRGQGLQDNFVTVLEWPDGATATLSQCLSGFEHHTALEVAGTDGALRTWWSGAMDRTLTPDFELKARRRGGTVERIDVSTSGEAFELEENLRRALAGFAAGKSILSPFEARTSIAVCLAAEQAWRTGAPVSLDRWLDGCIESRVRSRAEPRARSPRSTLKESAMKLVRIAAGALTLALTVLAPLSPALAQDKKKMTVLTWNLPVYEEKIRGWIKDFNQKYPDIEVEWIDKKGTEWATFYQTQIAAGTAPDIVNIQGALWAEYASDDRMLDLGPYLQKDPSFLDRYTKGALDLWKMNGKTYMVPWYFNKSLLFLNKPMMEKAGLTTPPKSFDDIMSYSKKMAGEGKTGFLTTNFDWLYWPLFKMNGVEVLNADLTKAAFNTPAAVKTLTQLAEGTKSGAINNISWTGRWVEPNTAFAAGNVGMYMAPNVALFWAASKADWINDNTVDVLDVPGAFAVPNHHGLGVSKSTKYPEAAVELLKIATSDKWQTVMADTFSLLTLNKAVDDKLIARLRTESPLKAKALDLVGQNLDRMTGYLLTPKEARVKDAFWAEVQPALLGQTDPKTALQKAEDKVNRALSRR